MSRRERSKEARRQQIVKAARRLIQETGEAGFTMQALADAADVSLMTPYNLFGSKRSVMIAVLDDDLTSYERKLARLRDDPLDKLFKAVSVARRLYDSEPNFYRAAFEGAAGGAANAEQRGAFRVPRKALWTRMVGEAMSAGFLHPDLGAELIATNIVHIFYSCVMDWLSGDIDLAAFEAHTQLGMALTLLGIATPEARTRLVARIEMCRGRLERHAAPADHTQRLNPAKARSG